MPGEDTPLESKKRALAEAYGEALADGASFSEMFKSNRRLQKDSKSNFIFRSTTKNLGDEPTYSA